MVLFLSTFSRKDTMIRISVLCFHHFQLLIELFIVRELGIAFTNRDGNVTLLL